MENMTEGTPKALEVVEPVTEASKASTPTPPVVGGMTPRQQTENTLNYLNATYNLLQEGLFTGQHSNVLIQVKAWIENQQKQLSLQMAFLIAADDEKKAGK